MTKSIIVQSIFEENKTIINVSFPKEQGMLSITESCFMLAQGISLLIKSSTKEDLGIKDHELMEMVMDILQHNFISTTEFDDAEIDKKMKIKK